MWDACQSQLSSSHCIPTLGDYSLVTNITYCNLPMGTGLSNCNTIILYLNHCNQPKLPVRPNTSLDQWVVTNIATAYIWRCMPTVPSSIDNLDFELTFS